MLHPFLGRHTSKHYKNRGLAVFARVRAVVFEAHCEVRRANFPIFQKSQKMFAQKTFFSEKERIFDELIKTETETPKARNRGNPGKTREKRPDRGSRGHTRPQHRRMNFMILHLSFGGGSGTFFPFFFVLPPVIFLVCPLFVADVVFLSFVFFIVSFVCAASFKFERQGREEKQMEET